LLWAPASGYASLVAASAHLARVTARLAWTPGPYLSGSRAAREPSLGAGAVWLSRVRSLAGLALRADAGFMGFEH
jgi:hypothetical protein